MKLAWRDRMGEGGGCDWPRPGPDGVACACDRDGRGAFLDSTTDNKQVTSSSALSAQRPPAITAPRQNLRCVLGTLEVVR